MVINFKLISQQYGNLLHVSNDMNITLSLDYIKELVLIIYQLKSVSNLEKTRKSNKTTKQFCKKLL